MSTYEIKRVQNGEAVHWDDIPAADIAHYMPNENGYYPRAYAKVCHTGTAFFVKFHVQESGIVADLVNYNDPVSQNSCVEFFVNAYPHVREDYLNFETSVLGTLLLGFGYIRPGRGRLWHIPPETFDIKSTVEDPALYNGSFWELTYTIPFDMINETYGAKGLGSGSRMRGNFYTVCAQGELRHAGTWNSTPAFHDRFGFGDLILE